MTDLFNTPCPHCGQTMPGTQETPFDMFYAKWPNKKGKQAAQKAFAKLSPQDRKMATDRAAGWFSDWRKANPQASPILPASYLNGRRWEDEGATAAKENVDRAAETAKTVKIGTFPMSYVSAHLARDMLDRKLVTKADLKRRSITY